MNGGGETASFLDFIVHVQLRFLQERDVGLDLYHSGLSGVGVFCLAVSSATVFLLAIFHLISSSRHTALLLASLGILAAGLGLLGTYLHYNNLEELRTQLIRETAGRSPLNSGEEAAVVALPLILGAITLGMNILGCLYLAIFWSSSLLLKRQRSKTRRK